MNTTQKVIYAIVAVLVIAGGVWYFIASDRPATRQDSASQDESAVVAMVNGEQIIRGELSLYEAQFANAQGADLASLDDATRKQIQDQAVEELVAGTLLGQAAADAGIVATDVEVDAQMATMREQFEGDEQFQSLLSAQGLTEANLRTQIANNLVVQAYFKQELGTDSIVATEKEIAALYEQQVGAAEDAPALSEVRGQIAEFVVQQKQQAILESHIQELRANAEVEILI